MQLTGVNGVLHLVNRMTARARFNQQPQVIGLRIGQPLPEIAGRSFVQTYQIKPITGQRRSQIGVAFR